MKSKQVRLGSLVVALLCATAALSYQLKSLRTPPDHGSILAREIMTDGSHTVTLLSQPYRLDKVYMSMTGPGGNHPSIRLAPDAPDDETIYLTGLRTDVVTDGTLSPASNELFCHSNLTLNADSTNPDKHNASFTNPTHADWRFFTLAPGRMELQLPQGFGLPIKAGTKIDYYTMALNQNEGEPERTIRMKTQVRFRRVGSDDSPVKPVFRRALYIYQQHVSHDAKGDEILQAAHQGEQCGEGCKRDSRSATPSLFRPVDHSNLAVHPGASCCVENASADGVLEQFGNKNTVHWMVPPGIHQYRTEVTEQFNLPRDTTTHYVTGHLHPFGSWMRLIDIETGKVVVEITGEHLKGRLGVKRMSDLSSREGIPLQKGRRYELVAEYNNTSGKAIDAMAILYMYLAE